MANCSVYDPSFESFILFVSKSKCFVDNYLVSPASVAQMNSSMCLISHKTPKLQIMLGTFPMWEVSMVMTVVVTSQLSDHPGITCHSVVSEEEKRNKMGILRRSNRDLTEHPETRRARSLYSDMMLAEQFTNPQAILDRIRVRPRLASPSPVRPEVTRPSVRRVKRRQKRLRWSDASMARSASSDHLAAMRSSCHCSCDLEDRRGMSLSVGSLCHLLEEPQDSQVKSQENTENKRVESEGGEHHSEHHWGFVVFLSGLQLG